jgi:toxin ParE1/3/4
LFEITVRPAARRDQIELAEYYESEGGESIALRFLQGCDDAFDQIASFPESGTKVRYRNPKLSKCRFVLVPGFENIVIFYLPMPTQIEIVRILHGARDIDNALDQ